MWPFGTLAELRLATSVNRFILEELTTGSGNECLGEQHCIRAIKDVKQSMATAARVNRR